MLEINGVNVTTKNGLYLLRDLHKASGGKSSKTPSFFMLNKSTKELIKEDGGEVIRERGACGGVWVNKQIVCAYAMWVSPKFFLKVINTFLAVAKGDLLQAAEIADTEASKNAALSLATSFIASDRFLFSNEEKALEVLKSAEKVQDSYVDRIKSKIELEILTKIPKLGINKLSLIHAVLNACNHSIAGANIDANSVNSTIDDMVEAGAIRSKGGIVTLRKT